MSMTLRQSIIATVITILLIAVGVSVMGCQWDSQANNSIRFLMDGEGAESRNEWAFGSLK